VLKRIYHKITTVTNSVIAKLHLFLERKQIIQPIAYTLYKHIDNATAVNHKDAMNLAPRDKALFAHYNHYPTDKETVFELQHVNISNSGVVFKGINNFGQALPHPAFRATYGWLYLLNQYLFHKKTIAPTPKIYILIYDFWSAGNYYHWLIDSLPRLWIIRDELKSEGYSLLLPENCPQFIIASLRYFEISHITYIKRSEYLSVEKLLIPNYSVGSGRIHPQRVAALKNYLVNKVNAGKQNERIYVSRGRQKTRRAINENEIIHIVEQLGFKVLYFEDYTVEEQIAIGKSAAVLVSSHGANMTNLMFMPPQARVLELIREDQPNFCYWALSSVVNVNYYYQLCKVVGNDHLLVNVDLFKLNLQKILND
jgi:hypothetical protein